MNMFPISESGYVKLQNKLEKLKIDFAKMPTIIAHAREKGDLKENAEYHAAREKQGMLNAQIQKTNSDIQNSKIINPSTLPDNLITFGKKLEIIDQSNQAKYIHRILGPAECEYEKNSISITSALGKGLLGKKVGDITTINVPSGIRTFKIISISL